MMQFSADSFFIGIAGRFRAWCLDGLRESFFFRLVGESRIIAWLVRHLPLVSGVAVGVLYIIPHRLFNNLYSLFVLLGLTVLTLAGFASGRLKKITMPRMGLYAALYWLMVVSSALFSTSFSLSLRFFFFHLTAFLALAVISTVLTDRRALLRFVSPLLAATALAGLYGMLQRVAGVAVVASQVDAKASVSLPGRIYSVYDNPNNFAEILVLMLPLFAAMFFMAKTRNGRRAAFFGALPSAVSLILTLSRSGWMALGLAAVIFFYFTYRWVVPVLFAVVPLALPLLPSTIYDRLISTFAGTDSSILYRSAVRDMLRPVLNENWFFGIGLGAEAVYAETVNFYELNWMKLNIASWKVAPHAHHLYLQLWAEMGIVGAASFCGMMITFFKRCIVKLFTSPAKNFIAAGGMAGMAGLLLMGFAEYVWFYPRVHLLFWVVAGVTLAALRIETEEISGH